MEPPARLHRRLRLSTDTEGETVTVRNRVPAAAVSTTTTPAAAASASSTSAPNGVRRSGRTSVPTARIMENRCQETHDRRVSPRIVSRSASPPSTNSRLQPVVDEEEELPLYDDRHDWMSREDYEAQIEPLSKVNNKKNKSIHDEAVLNAFGGDDGSCTDGSDSDGNNLTTWASNNLTAGRPRRRPRVSWKEEMDLALLTVLADVGTGNWPRVLLTAHNMHLLTGVTVCWGVRESSSISLTRSFFAGSCCASSPLQPAPRPQELARVSAQGAQTQHPAQPPRSRAAPDGAGARQARRRASQDVGQVHPALYEGRCGFFLCDC